MSDPYQEAFEDVLRQEATHREAESKALKERIEIDHLIISRVTTPDRREVISVDISKMTTPADVDRIINAVKEKIKRYG